MTTDEINRYIAVEIMGLCPHEEQDLRKYINPGRQITTRCKRCDRVAIFKDYCSDNSPRSLLNEVVAKIVGKNGRISSRLYDRLDDAMSSQNGTDGHHLMLTAEQIARAAVAAHQAK